MANHDTFFNQFTLMQWQSCSAMDEEILEAKMWYSFFMHFHGTLDSQAQIRQTPAVKLDRIVLS